MLIAAPAFRLNVSPVVTAVRVGLIALWPRRRSVRARYVASVGRATRSPARERVAA